MTARVETAAGGEIPAQDLPVWCQMWADGDRRLRAMEISAYVLGRRLPPEPGQLWERLRGDDCEPGCRHRCPVCRMGLVTHLPCDPLCEART